MIANVRTAFSKLHRYFRNDRASAVRLAASRATRGRVSRAIEMLEQRQMLTQFVTGASFNFQTAPHNLTQTLNEDAGSEISIEDFVLHHLSGNADISREDLSFSYDSPTKTSTIAFPGLSNSGLTGMLADGNYDLILNDFTIPDLVGESIYSFFHLIADLNHDRAIGWNDFSTLNGNFNQSGDWSDGDINGDGVVNISDYQILSANYGRQMPAPLTAANSISCYALSESAIRLNWNPPSSGSWDGFRIFMSTDGTVTLDTAFKPGASPNVNNAIHVNTFFGIVGDISGIGRSLTEDTWTKGAVQR